MPSPLGFGKRACRRCLHSAAIIMTLPHAQKRLSSEVISRKVDNVVARRPRPHKDK